MEFDPPSGIAGHGGSLDAARARHPGAPEPLVDLSTGINPVPYPIAPLGADALRRLPEPGALASLERRAARAYGAGDPACVVAGPGTGVLAALIALLSDAASAAIVMPTYAGHRAAWRAAGRAVVPVPDLDAAARSGASAIVTCRPNNPDGRIDDADALRVLARERGRAGGFVLVDEAFADLEPCGGDLVDHQEGLVRLRSFGKTYGLAGVRLGFAIADRRLADRLRAALGAWPVSITAIAAGREALPDLGWRERTAGRLAEAAIRLDALLEGHGVVVRGGTRLFRDAAHPQAGGLADALGRAGIVVRSFEGDATRLRFGLPPDAAVARLEAALGGWQGQGLCRSTPPKALPLEP